MKRLTILVVALMVTCMVSAQNFKKKASGGGGFDIDAPGIEKTQEMMKIDGKSYEVFKTDKGSAFIKCLSPNSGKYYPVWIGRETEHTFEGRKVYQMKSGTYCVYQISKKTGNPYAVYLDAE